MRYSSSWSTSSMEAFTDACVKGDSDWSITPDLPFLLIRESELYHLVCRSLWVEKMPLNLRRQVDCHYQCESSPLLSLTSEDCTNGTCLWFMFAMPEWTRSFILTLRWVCGVPLSELSIVGTPDGSIQFRKSLVPFHPLFGEPMLDVAFSPDNSGWNCRGSYIW